MSEVRPLFDLPLRDEIMMAISADLRPLDVNMALSKFMTEMIKCQQQIILAQARESQEDFDGFKGNLRSSVDHLSAAIDAHRKFIEMQEGLIADMGGRVDRWQRAHEG